MFIEAMPQLWQTDPQIDDDVESLQGPAGCYDTCITMASIAALADTPAGRKPATGSRTAQFQSVKAEGNVSREVKQLSWQYRTAMNKKPYYFYELVRDFGPIQQGCDAFDYHNGGCRTVTSGNGAAFRDFIGGETHVNNEYIQELLSRSIISVIAFRRYAPSATFNNARGGWDVTLTESGLPHKLTFRGFKGSGPFPLLLNDPGDGELKEGRLVVGLSGRGFGHTQATGSAIKSVTAPTQCRIYLEYKRLNEPLSADPHATVNLVDHVDGVSLLWQPPTKLFTGRWGTGWTQFVPFKLGGVQHFIAYNGGDGTVHFDRFPDNLNGSVGIFEGRWATGWTLTPFTFGGQPHLIAYNPSSGDVHFDRINANLRGTTTLFDGQWATGWRLTPFTFGGQPHLIAYNPSSGDVHFDRINANLRGTTTLFDGQWATGWSLMPFSIAGDPHLIAYNPSNGAVHFDRINESLRGTTTLVDTNWSAGWRLTPVPYLGRPHFTAYKPSTGELHFDKVHFNRTTGRVDGMDILWIRQIPPAFTAVMPFDHRGLYCHLFYNAASGTVEFYQVDPL